MFTNISQNLSVKHYQENKERLQKKLVKDIKIFLRKKKKKKQQYDCERHKNLSKDEKNNMVGHRKKCYRKRFIRKYLNLEKFAFYKEKYEKIVSFGLMFQKK